MKRGGGGFLFKSLLQRFSDRHHNLKSEEVGHVNVLLPCRGATGPCTGPRAAVIKGIVVFFHVKKQLEF